MNASWYQITPSRGERERSAPSRAQPPRESACTRRRDDGARLLDAQLHGAVIQWALEPEGPLGDCVKSALRDWFRLAGV